MPLPKIYMSNRFRKAYDRASLTLKNMAESKVHELVNLYRADPSTVLHRYDTVAGLKTRVKEADLAGAERMLFDIGVGYIFLLHMGGHEIVSRYSDAMASRDFTVYEAAPAFFWPESGGFFARRPDLSLPFKWDEERALDKWLYYLDDGQSQVNEEIGHHLLEVANESWDDMPPSFFIIGGPGTGKTCILLDLLRCFSDIDPDFQTRIIISDDLARLVEQATGANLAPYRTSFSESWWDVDLLLVDDPPNKWKIEQVLKAAGSGNLRAAVIAFDPLQLDKALPDADYEELRMIFEVRDYPLNSCYRQKANVGRVTKHVVDMIADSSPFSADTKIRRHREEHAKLTALANEMRFVNPAGYVEYYPDATIGDIQQEVARILQNSWLMWKEYPGLLVVEGLSERYALSDDANGVLSVLENQGYVRRVSLHSVEEVKGLEFQHVFIFIDKGLFNEVQTGFTGTGRKIYDRRRLFRIPFSRAKDSIVTFAIEQETQE